MHTQKLQCARTSTFVLCIFLLTGGLCLAQTATTIAAGELRLDGSVQSYNAAKGQLILNANSFTLASGKSHDISPAKSKTIVVNAKTIFIGTDGKIYTQPIFTNGILLTVIGSDSGSNNALVARTIVVQKAATTIKTTATSPRNSSDQKIILNGQVKSILSGEMITMDVYERTGAQNKTEEIDPPKEQKIHLDANTTIVATASPATKMSIGDIQLGQHISVTGKYGEPETSFEARDVVVSQDQPLKLQIVGSATIHPLVAELLIKGRDASHAGAYSDALQFDKKASQTALEKNDTMGNALSQNALGLVYDAMHEASLATAAFQSSIELSQSVGDQASAAIAMGNLGGHYAMNHDGANAAKSYEAALNMIPSNEFPGKQQLKNSIYYNGAFAYLATDQKDKAIQFMQLALDTARGLKDIPSETHSTLYLADFEVRDKRFKEALVDVKPASGLIPQLTSKEEQASSWSELYAILRLCNSDDQAEQAYSKAEQLYTELNDKDKLDTLKSQKATLDISAELQKEIDKSKELLKKNDELMKSFKKSLKEAQTPKQ